MHTHIIIGQINVMKKNSAPATRMRQCFSTLNHKNSHIHFEIPSYKYLENKFYFDEIAMISIFDYVEFKFHDLMQCMQCNSYFIFIKMVFLTFKPFVAVLFWRFAFQCVLTHTWLYESAHFSFYVNANIWHWFSVCCWFVQFNGMEWNA